MSHRSDSHGKSLTSKGLQSGLIVSVLLVFPLLPSGDAHDMVGEAAPHSGSLHGARAKARGCHQGAAVPGWHSWISWRNHRPQGVPGVRGVLALWLRPHTRSTSGLVSGMGCSCLGSTCGQNSGVCFEKKTCLLFFKQQKGKLKDWDLPSRFSLRH